ncbi:MAG: NADH-quinone oxidoreductase subunit H [Sphingobacteriaceae bacterium]|nr:MAG: NADH-quinone oxidoreductase subunit H [Sphingobacteriaceae bacterium]
MPSDYNWLVLLAILSLTIYAQLLLGWAANSAYAFLGSLRSSAALISYELILSTAGLVPMLLSQSYSLQHIIEGQTSIIYAIPLLPVFMIFLISTLAEASRVPFDLVEAESELVSGYMTEHASVAFTLLFLTEYASILLFSSLNAILWFGTSYYTHFALAVSAMLSFVILARALLPRMRYDQLISFC